MTSTDVRGTRPFSIRLFEIVFLLAMLLYPVVVEQGRRLTTPIDLLTHGMLLGAMIVAQLFAMVMVARRRQKRARWLICALLILDVPMYMALLPASSLDNNSFLLLSLLQFSLHCLSVFLLFTPSTSNWLVAAGHRQADSP